MKKHSPEAVVGLTGMLCLSIGIGMATNLSGALITFGILSLVLAIAATAAPKP